MAGGCGVRFAWQEGYGAFGVSQSQRDAIADYIGRQEEHHRKWSFVQEFMTLLRKSGGQLRSEICVWVKRMPSRTGLSALTTRAPSIEMLGLDMLSLRDGSID